MGNKKTRLPDWYWSKGLHDAKILSVSKKEVSWDPSDNSLIFKIDGDGAMFE